MLFYKLFVLTLLSWKKIFQNSIRILSSSEIKLKTNLTCSFENDQVWLSFPKLYSVALLCFINFLEVGHLKDELNTTDHLCLAS